MKDLVSIQQNEKSHIDIDLSMIALTKEDNNDSKPKFLSIKQDKQKAFRIKKLFNELPVMEVLKIRKPQVYKSNFLCPRCNDKKETINHLYKCSKADNDVLMLQRIAKDKLIKWIRKSEKFRNIDELIEELFPFFKTTKQLQRFTKANSDYYSNFDNYKFRQEYTYIWNGTHSMDDILKGWIPSNLINILRKYQINDNKKIIRSILTKWLGKVNILFFNWIWKKRNDDTIAWEEKNGITALVKKTKTSSKKPSRSKSEERNTRKRRITGNKKATFHVIDEELYVRIRRLFGFNPNFHQFLDKGVTIFFRILICGESNLY